MAANSLISCDISYEYRPHNSIIPCRKEVKESPYDYYYAGLQNFYVFKDYPAAVNDFETAVLIKKCANSFKMLGLPNYINGRYQDSVAALTNSIKHSSSCEDFGKEIEPCRVSYRYLYYKRAMAKLKLGCCESALEDFKNSLKYQCDSYIKYGHLHWGMALSKIGMGDYIGGIKLLNSIKHNKYVNDYKDFIIKKYKLKIKTTPTSI